MPSPTTPTPKRSLPGWLTPFSVVRWGTVAGLLLAAAAGLAGQQAFGTYHGVFGWAAALLLFECGWRAYAHARADSHAHAGQIVDAVMRALPVMFETSTKREALQVLVDHLHEAGATVNISVLADDGVDCVSPSGANDSDEA